MMRKKIIQLLPAVLALLLLGAIVSACASGGAQTSAPTSQPTTASATTPSPAVPQTTAFQLTDGLGRTVTLPAPAQRVASMAPSNTEILFAVGAGKQVVGRDEFSDYPPEAASLPSIGGSMGKYNTETIISLKPDLVLASELNTPEQVKALEDVGIPVFYLKNPTNLEGMYANLLTVAQLTGHTQETTSLVDSLKQRAEAVTAKTALLPDDQKPLVFYEIDSSDPNAPYTSGPGTFIDYLIREAGGKNAGDALGAAYGQLSLEQLLVDNPAIIVLGDYTWGGVTPQDVGKRAGWDQLKAVQDGNVFTFDDNLVSRPGPRNVDGLEAMAKLLHPELFK